ALLEDGATLILSEAPPRFVLTNRNERCPRCFRPAECGLGATQGVCLATRDVTRMAHHASQLPLSFARRSLVAAFVTREVGRLREPSPAHGGGSHDPPRPYGASGERYEQGRRHSRE